MGYKYGVWLTYKRTTFPTTHVGHFTISCYMEKKDALCLYDDIREKHGLRHILSLNKEGIKFCKNMYEDDNNNLGSWGYNAQNRCWDEFENLSKKYYCNFSHQPHTSIAYSKETECLQPINLEDEMAIVTELHVADITNDDPEKWKLIK